MTLVGAAVLALEPSRRTDCPISRLPPDFPTGMARFDLQAPYVPTERRPTLAIAALTKGVDVRERFQTLWVPPAPARPFRSPMDSSARGGQLWFSPITKTRAAQLCNELREFFAEQRRRIFISYLRNYYQAEAYVCRSRTPTSPRRPRSTKRSTCCVTRPPAPCFERRGRDCVRLDQLAFYGLGIPSGIPSRPAVKFQGGETSILRGSLRELVNNQYSRN